MALKFSTHFFWLSQLRKIVWTPFWWAVLMLIIFWVPFLRVWWWFFAPVFLVAELRTLYLWWVHWDYNYQKRQWVVLEIIPPKEIVVPLKAMEDVFTVMWGPLLAPANWRETWFEGELTEMNGWMSWEIASIEGDLHYYLRVMAPHRATLETVLYSHYPELEIHEVADYAKNVPQVIPNEEWDVYGEDFALGKEDILPIRTYEKFFEPEGQRIADEEKRLDPISSLLELMSRLGPGEQYWIQFITSSIDSNSDESLYKEAKSYIGKMFGRPEKRKKSFWDELTEVFYNLVMGPQKEGKGEKATYKWFEITHTESSEREGLMTPGEREVVNEVENKMRKPLYRTNISAVYVARRENFKSGHKTLARSYFAHFQTSHMNFIKFFGATRPKTQYVFRERIPYLRNRRLFRNYVLRLPTLFPNRKTGSSAFSTEELATMYHFPVKITGLMFPTMVRVESKRGGPPPNLPT